MSKKGKLRKNRSNIKRKLQAGAVAGVALGVAGVSVPAFADEIPNDSVAAETVATNTEPVSDTVVIGGNSEVPETPVSDVNEGSSTDISLEAQGTTTSPETQEPPIQNNSEPVQPSSETDPVPSTEESRENVPVEEPPKPEPQNSNSTNENVVEEVKKEEEVPKEPNQDLNQPSTEEEPPKSAEQEEKPKEENQPSVSETKNENKPGIEESEDSRNNPTEGRTETIPSDSSEVGKEPSNPNTEIKAPDSEKNSSESEDLEKKKVPDTEGKEHEQSNPNVPSEEGDNGSKGGNNDEENKEKPPFDETPTEQKEDSTRPSRFEFTLNGEKRDYQTGSKPIQLVLNDVTTLTYDKTSDVTYKQVTYTGIDLDIHENGLLPTPSRVVAVGKYGEVTVAEVSSDKSYPLSVSYNQETSSIGYHFSDELLKGDTFPTEFTVELDGRRVSTLDFNNGLIGGEIKLNQALLPGVHTFNIRGNTLYGLPVLGTAVVTIEEKKEEETPKEPEKDDSTDTGNNNVIVAPQPNPVIPIEPNNPPNRPNENANQSQNPPTQPLNPIIPPINNGNTITNPIPNVNENTGSSSVITFPSLNNNGNNQPNNPFVPNQNNASNQQKEVVAPPVVKEPPRGVSDVSVGGVSIYGEEGVKGVGVVSNRGMTTFTDPSSLDLRVNLDSKIVDSSRTVLKLVGREQGELNSSEFIEMKNGSYRLKGVAKDDLYTLSIKAYDKNGKLVTDTTETFSINRKGSRFNFDNKELSGKSVQSLSNNVVISEVNIDKIDTDKTRIRITKDGKVIEVDKNLVKTKVSGGKNSPWKYSYTIDKKAFKKDGIYNIEIFSESETGVKYDSTKRTIQFTVDTKGPEIEVLGIKSKGRYKSSKREIVIQTKDMSNISSVKAFLNGKEVALKYDKDSRTYSYVLESKGEDKNTLVVEATDEAGNVSTQSVEDFYLSEDLSWSLLNDNNLYYLFGGLIFAGTAFLGFLGWKRKKRLEEEDRLAMEQAALLVESQTASQQLGDEVSEESIKVEEILDNQTKTAPTIVSEEVVSIDSETITEIQPTEGETTLLIEDEVTELLDEEIADVLEDFEKTEILSEGQITEVLEDEEATDILPDEETETSEQTNIIEEDDFEKTEILEDEEFATDVLDDEE